MSWTGLAVLAVATLTALAPVYSSKTEGKGKGKIAFGERIIDAKADAYRIVVMSADGSSATKLPLAPRHSYGPSWSPEGTKIAFENFDWGGGVPTEVWVMDADGGGQHKLAGNASEPAWSPDGRTIAFRRAGGIYVMDSDGSNQRRLIRNARAPAWSPDGTQIAFVRSITPGCTTSSLPRCVKRWELYVMRANGTEQRRLTRNRVYEDGPDWSPSGTQLVFERSSAIFAMNADGRGQRRLTGRIEAYEPAWSPDGNKIVYARQGVTIVTMNADGTGRRELHGCPHQCGSPAWSAG